MVKKLTQAGGARKSATLDTEPTAAVRDDGLSVRRHRPRHDEARAPRGHRLAPDDWPIRVLSPDPRAAEPTDEDRALWEDTIRAMNFALALGVTDDARRAVRDAYRAIIGHDWEEQWTAMLGRLLRELAQGDVRDRIQQHRHGAEAPPIRAPGRSDPPVTGRAIAARLSHMATTLHRTRSVPIPEWVTHPRLAAAIEATRGSISLGGPGGRNRGKTPETWARDIAKALAANSRRK